MARIIQIIQELPKISKKKLWKLLIDNPIKCLQMYTSSVTQEMCNYAINTNISSIDYIVYWYINDTLFNSIDIEKRAELNEKMLYYENSSRLISHNLTDIFHDKIKYWMIWDLLTTYSNYCFHNNGNNKNSIINLLKGFNETERKTLLEKYWLCSPKYVYCTFPDEIINNYKISVDIGQYRYIDNNKYLSPEFIRKLYECNSSTEINTTNKIIKDTLYDKNIIYDIFTDENCPYYNNNFLFTSKSEFELFTNNKTLCNLVWFMLYKSCFISHSSGLIKNKKYIINIGGASIDIPLDDNLISSAKTIILTSIPKFGLPTYINYEIIRLIPELVSNSLRFHEDNILLNKLISGIRKKQQLAKNIPENIPENTRLDMCKNGQINKVKFLTQQEILTYINECKNACFSSLPSLYKTYEMFLLFLKNNRLIISYEKTSFRKKLLNDMDTLVDIINENPKCIDTIYSIYQNEKTILPVDLIIASAKYCYNGFELLRRMHHALITHDIIKSALKHDGTILKLVPYKMIKKKYCKIAVKQNGISLFYVPRKYRTPNLEAIAFGNNPDCFKCLDNPTYEQQLVAVKHNGNNILYIENASKELWIEAVKQNNKMMKFVNPSIISHELAKDILEKDATMIRYIERPTDEMWLSALKRDGMLLYFCSLQKEIYCIEALKQTPKAVIYILSFTDGIKKILEQQTPYAYIYYN